MMMETKILIDNGHGAETTGKRSPDGRLHEYAYTREIAARVINELKRQGYDAELLVPEVTDISLSERCRRANAWSKSRGATNVLVVSIHNDAAGADGQWHDARGFSVRVAPNASTRSKLLARCLYEAAERQGKNVTGNRSVPKEKYWVQNLAICRDTACPAILTENLFQDNREDVSFLLSEAGKRAITQLHVEGIVNYINSK